MKNKISVHIDGIYRENKETTFNYYNRSTNERHQSLSKEKVIELAQKDYDNGLLIGCPSELVSHLNTDTLKTDKRLD